MLFVSCAMEDCPSLLRNGKPNDIHWEGVINYTFLPKHVPPSHSIIVYKFYNIPFLCVSICDVRIYYVVHKLPNMTRACIHFGLHNHLVSNGDYCESIEITKELVRCELEKNPRATISAITLVANKTL